jgi:hypothetical protein
LEYTVKKEPGIQTVVIEVSGFINTNIGEEMILAAGCALNLSGFKRVLFDVSKVEIDPNQTMTGMFMFSEVFIKANIKKSVRIAALNVGDGKLQLHLEKAVSANGFNIKHFNNRDEALSWLCR